MRCYYRFVSSRLLFFQVFTRPVQVNYVQADHPVRFAPPVHNTHPVRFAPPVHNSHPVQYVPPVQYNLTRQPPVNPLPYRPVGHIVREYTVPVHGEYNNMGPPPEHTHLSARSKKPRSKKQKTPRDRTKTDYSSVKETGRLLSYAAHELNFENIPTNK
ncbi:uncharacterized protein LOC111119165 [Crassostrea virginica]